VATQSSSSVPTIGSFVNGAFLIDDQPSLTSVNPAHPDEVLAEVVVSTLAQAAEAVWAAEHAQLGWAALSGPARADYLYRWADQIQLRAGEIGNAVAREVGKPIGEAKGEVGRCVAILRYFAGDAVRESGQVIPGLAAGSLQYSLRRPLGVVGLITPWNFPVAIPLWKAAPALACGNTVVLKPAETSLLCATLLAETAQAAGLPAGVFNVLIGDGPSLGAVLLNDKAVRAVSFTGSSRVGAIVSEACAKRNAKFQTEMGGKNAAIILPDADLKQAAVLVAGGAMRFAGQKCTATSRVIVHRQIRDAFQAELISAIQQLKVSDPLEADCAVGPVISEASKLRIEKALSWAGDPVYTGSVPSTGYFVPPTLLADVDASAEVAQEEIFGPVLALLVADDLDDAIQIANGVEFGLSASLFTKDIGSAMSYVSRIEAGLVRVNADTTGVDPHAPFGGVKGSSSGTREQGPAAKDFYTEYKTVQINPA
jgi:aldehyde dehydrogenase (NAD+)